MSRVPIRLAGIAGIAFVLLIVVPSFATGSPPDTSDAASKFVTYFQNNRTGIIATTFCGGAADFFIVFFLGGLLTTLRRQGAAIGLIIAALVAIILTGATATLGGVFTAAAAFRLNGPQHVDAETVRLFSDAASVSFTLLGFTLSAFLLSLGVMMMGARLFPRWLGWFGAVGAVLEIVATFGVFSSSGALGLGGFLGFIFGLVPFGLFMLATGIVMVIRGKAMDALPA